MENNGSEQTWRFASSRNEALVAAGLRSIRSVLTRVFNQVEQHGPRPIIPLGHGDPSAFPCFQTTPAAVEAFTAAVQSAKYNSYSATTGLEVARSAVADHLSHKLPYKVYADDVFLTCGCNQAIEVVTTVLAMPGANILLPKPGYPMYEAQATFSNLEFRHFDLIPERGWEVDLEAVESLADEHTVAMVIINPSNPCGSVYTYEQLGKIAETAKKLGILVISDEVYDHAVFGTKPFVPMGTFGEIAPVVTLGSISKTWVVPGWRLGWLAITDPKGILRKTKVVEAIINYASISTDPASVIQGAIPDMINNTDKEFFRKTVDLLRETAEICYSKIKEINCITCPHKPEGSMFVMVKLNLSCLEGIDDDIDFCNKLAKEESVILLPGSGVGMRNWLRVTFSVDPPLLQLGLDKLKSFCKRHAKA